MAVFRTIKGWLHQCSAVLAQPCTGTVVASVVGRSTHVLSTL